MFSDGVIGGRPGQAGLGAAGLVEAALRSGPRLRGRHGAPGP